MASSFAFVTPDRDLALADWDPALPAPARLRPLISRGAPALCGEDGSPPLALTAPTWSPDGSLLAFSAVYHASLQQTGAAVGVVDVENGAAALIFQGAPGLEALIAPGLPHYVTWSPDGRHLALLAQTPSGMTLFIVDRAGIRPSTAVASGAPLFFAWSPSGDALIVHRAGDLMLVDLSAPESPSLFPRSALACLLPAWSETGEALALAQLVGRGVALCLLSRDGEDREILPLAAASATLAWRPGTNALAYSPRLPGPAASGRGLLLCVLDGAEPERLTDLPVDVFLWSPDGSRLAVLSPAHGSGLCFWSTIEVETKAVQRYAPFYQSAELALMSAFFEQYATSHRLWSATGDALLTSGRLPSNGTPPETAGGSVYVQPVDAGAAPIFAAQGAFASWRPS